MSVQHGTPLGDLINGFDSQDDFLYGEGGDDTIEGMNGDDKIDGGPGNDTLIGREQIDLIIGGAGDDSITGGWGDDRLLGGVGDDFLAGGGFNDVVNGGLGDDRLKGGHGADIFVFSFDGSKNTGKDIILDFHDNLETIFIDHRLGFNTVKQVLNHSHSSGGDSVIDLSKTGADSPQIIIVGLDDFHKLANDIVIF